MSLPLMGGVSGAEPESARDALDGLYATGHWLYTHSRFHDAATVFRALVWCAPTDERGWLSLGACHEAVGQKDIALEIYGAAGAVAQTAGRCELARARIYRARAMETKANEAIERAVEIAEENDDDALRALVAKERRQ